MGAPPDNNQRNGEQTLGGRARSPKLAGGDLVERRRPSNAWDGRLVLCLDGGGIQGIASLVLLQALVREIADIERSDEDSPAFSSDSSPLFQTSDTSLAGRLKVSTRDSQRHDDSYLLCHYFDYIGGTSSGGIAAIMLGCMRLSIHETIDRTKRVWRGMFPTVYSRLIKAIPQVQSKSKNSSRITEALQVTIDEVFEAYYPRKDSEPKTKAEVDLTKKTMKTSIARCQTVVFAMQNATKGVLRPYAIRSYVHLSPSSPLVRNPEKDTTKISILDTCRATSAAPQYFEKVQIDSHGSFLDGGIWKTNPAAEVYREVSDLHANNEAQIAGLLSVGCSTSARKDSNPKLTRKLSDLVDQVMEDNTDSMLRERKRLEGFEYDRLVCPTSSDLTGSNLDKWFETVSDDAQSYIAGEVLETIRRWAKFLVAVRRRRARTVRWEAYAGLRQYCPLCSRQDSSMDSVALFEHIQSEHGIGVQSLGRSAKISK